MNRRGHPDWDIAMRELNEFAESLERTGEPPPGVEVRHYRFVPMRPFAAGRVKKVRSAVAASRVQFAALLGVTPQTIAAWESGTRKPNKMARRFLTEVESNPVHFRTRLATVTELELSR